MDSYNGLNLYDFEARFLDSSVPGFTTQDPLSEKYYNISPYAYVANNPINAIDPDGRDWYLLREDGTTVLALKTEHDYDNLISINLGAEGLKNKVKSIRVNDKGLLPQLAGNPDTKYNGHYGVTENADDAFSVFQFAADNSNVEWGLNGYNTDSGNQFLLMTSHSEDKVTNTHGAFSETNMKFDLHSHPDDMAGKGASGYSVGFRNQISYSGDMKFVSNRYYRFSDAGKRYPSQFPNHYVYNVKQKNLYHYTPWNPNNKTFGNITSPSVLKNSILNKKYNK